MGTDCRSPSPRRRGGGGFIVTKYELGARHPGLDLRRIVALRSFYPLLAVEAGDVGGWVSGEHNLSQDGYAWVFDDAMVMDEAVVEGNARITNNAEVRDHALVGGWTVVGDKVVVKDDAQVFGHATVSGNAQVSGKSRLYGNAWVADQVEVSGKAKVSSFVSGFAKISDSATVTDHALVGGEAQVYGRAVVGGQAEVGGNAHIYGDALVGGQAQVGGNAVVCEGSADIGQQGGQGRRANRRGNGVEVTSPPVTQQGKADRQIMRRITIYGASDDLMEVEYEGSPGRQSDEPDEMSAIQGGVISITDGQEGLLVTAGYSMGGVASTWCVGVAQLDDGVPLPKWPLEFVDKHKYSVGLIVEVPASAVVKDVTRR